MQQRIAIALGTLLALAAIRAHADGTGWATTTLTYDGAAIGNIDGGAARSSTYVGNAHLRSLLDLDRALGWTGTHAYVDALWIHGGQPGAFVGDAMGVSNLSAPPNLQLEEAWIEHNLADANVSVLAGLYDVNSEFDRTQSGGLFLNSAFGIGPEFAQTGVDGPSIFPRTALGARVAFKAGRRRGAARGGARRRAADPRWGPTARLSVP